MFEWHARNIRISLDKYSFLEVKATFVSEETRMRDDTNHTNHSRARRHKIECK